MRNFNFILSIALVAGGASLAHADGSTDPAHSRHAKAMKTKLRVTSQSFKANEAIPSDFTCEGTQQAPELSWSHAPDATKSIAILVEDKDAPKHAFTHWLVTGISPDTMSLAAGAALPDGAIAAKNDNGEAGYTGPCPPSGTHHYIFRVYALDIPLAGVANKTEFIADTMGHVLAEGELTGTYKKAH